MEKVGIICEYNPFHNGHLYHINKIKSLYPDSIIILILNGYFLQRGEISILSKEEKTKIALNYGVDIVIELPVIFGTQSADNFAYYSVKYLNELGVNRIIFGSESNDINALTKLAKKQIDNENSIVLKKYLNNGDNYPTSLAKSLETSFSFNSNDLLGISYIKAGFKINNNIIFETIQRTNDFLDTKSNEKIISAQNIREKIKNNISIDEYIPCKENLLNINKELLFNIIKEVVLQNDGLSEYLDVDEGIENRLYKGVIKTNNIDDLIEFIKTKRYTYNKIRRMIIHIILGIKKDINNSNSYIKLLGFNKKGQKYLNSIKIKLTIDKKSNQYIYEEKASIIYDMLTNSNTYDFEKSSKPIKKEN